MSDLTPEERKAIRAIKRIAKTWPDTLWLFADGGAILFLRTGPGGRHVVDEHGCVDRSYEVGSVSIPAEGGW